jgi:threonine synthase
MGDPADGRYALGAVRETGGAIGAVSDGEVIDGIRLLAETEGIFAETAGGVTIATLARLVDDGVIDPDERVVALVTGHGLKTVEALGFWVDSANRGNIGWALYVAARPA